MVYFNVVIYILHFCNAMTSWEKCTVDLKCHSLSYNIIAVNLPLSSSLLESVFKYALYLE